MTLELDISTLLLAFGAFSGTLLFPLFLLLGRGNFLANRILGVTLLIFTLVFWQNLLLQLLPFSRGHYLVNLTFPLYFALGPLLYLYVKSCTQEPYQIRRHQWLHFLPVLFAFFFQLEFLLDPPAQKIAWWKDVQDGSPVLDYLLQSGLKIGHLFVYYLLSIREVRRYHRHLQNVKTYVDLSYETWLYAYTSGFLLLVCLATGLVIMKFHDSLEIAMSLVFFLILLATQLAALVRPEIFHGFPEPREPEEPPRDGQPAAFSTEEREAFRHQLDKHMRDSRAYEDPELSLPSLADQLHLSRHELSRIINTVFERNFMDFVNSYRVEALQKLLADPEKEPYTILALAFEVGFNSKSAFYSAFKKVTGQTPSQYRRKQLATKHLA